MKVTMTAELFFATRPSALARWQTQWVMRRLEAAHPGLRCNEVVITTHGDKVLDKPLPEIGGKGLFTQELEAELLSGHVQCAVHSLKDLPVEDSSGLTLGAIPMRGEARDAVVSRDGQTLHTLPSGAVVGTSSLRRSAQVLRLRPDLRMDSLRGNVDTRVRKALQGQYDAIVLAGAGLTRLGLDPHVSEWLTFEVMLPAPGQGALAVQCRSDDESTLELLSAVEDAETRGAVTAERSFLEGLGGGCSVPVAAYGQKANDGKGIHLTGLVISVDGKKDIRVEGAGSDAHDLGIALAQQALAQGAAEILKPATVKEGEAE